MLVPRAQWRDVHELGPDALPRPSLCRSLYPSLHKLLLLTVTQGTYKDGELNQPSEDDKRVVGNPQPTLLPHSVYPPEARVALWRGGFGVLPLSSLLGVGWARLARVALCCVLCRPGTKAQASPGPVLDR